MEQILAKLEAIEARMTTFETDISKKYGRKRMADGGVKSAPPTSKPTAGCKEQPKQKTKAASRTIFPKSANSAFKELSKKLAKYVQHKNAERRWTSGAPDKVRNDFLKAAKTVTMPATNDFVRAGLERIVKVALTEITSLAVTHTRAELEKLQKEFTALNPLDKERASKVATTYAAKQFKGKLPDTFITGALEEALSFVGQSYAPEPVAMNVESEMDTVKATKPPTPIKPTETDAKTKNEEAGTTSKNPFDWSKPAVSNAWVKPIECTVKLNLNTNMNMNPSALNKEKDVEPPVDATNKSNKLKLKENEITKLREALATKRETLKEY